MSELDEQITLWLICRNQLLGLLSSLDLSKLTPDEIREVRHKMEELNFAILRIQKK
jgi:hypothetical protein